MQEIIAKTKKIIFSPKEFFKDLNEPKIKDAFVFAAFWSLVRAVLAFLISIPIASVFGKSLSYPQVVLGFIAELIIGFVAAFLLYLWLRLFGGKGNYLKTYQLYVYSNTPNMLLGWLPIISIIAGIYGLYILIVGTREIHKIGNKKSILIYLIPMIVIVILLLVGTIFAFSSLYKFGFPRLR